MKSRLVLPGLYSTYLYSKKVELDLFSIQNTKCSDLLILIFRGTLAPCLSILSSSLIPILSESTSRLLLTNGKKSVGPDSHAPAVSLYVLYTTSNWPISATTCYRDVTITEELTSQSESKHRCSPFIGDNLLFTCCCCCCSRRDRQC